MPKRPDSSKERSVCRLRLSSVILIICAIVLVVVLLVFSISDATKTHTKTPNNTTLIGGDMSTYKHPCDDIPGIKSHHPIAYYLNKDKSGVLSCPWTKTRSAVRITVGAASLIASVFGFIICHIKHTRWAYLTSIIVMALAIATAYTGVKDINAYVSADKFCKGGMTGVPFKKKTDISCKMETFVSPIILGAFSFAVLLASGCMTIVFICKAGKSFSDPDKKKHASSDDFDTPEEGGGAEEEKSVNGDEPKKKKSGFSLFGRKKKAVAEGDTDFEKLSEQKEFLSESEREEASGDGVDFEKESQKRFSPFSRKKEQSRESTRSLFGSKQETPEPDSTPSSASSSLTGNDLFRFESAEDEKEPPKSAPKSEPKPQPKPEPKAAPSGGSSDDFFDFESIPESKK